MLKVLFNGNLLLILQHKISKMGEYKIKVILLDEALAFVRSLPLKVQEKIVYNYKKIEAGLINKELFKKLDDSGHCTMVIAIGCFLSGTLRQIPLLLPPMAL